MERVARIGGTVGKLFVLGGLFGVALALTAAAPAKNAMKPKPTSCVECHADAVKAIGAPGGAHAGLACADCHGEAHPPKGDERAPSCASCHEGHGAAMAATDCARCHTAHRPREVRYGLDVPPAHCGACHDAALAALTATKSRHKPLRCVLCHQKEHGKTQGCAHCHGSPHPPEMVKADAACGSCHGTAHDLGKVAEANKG